MVKHAIILVRVSSYIQDLGPQKTALKEYAKSLGFTKIHVIETKESGLVDEVDKVGTSEMFKFIEQNPKYNTVFCTEISRLARRQTVLFSLRDWFVDNRIQLILKEGNYKLFDEDGTVSESGYNLFALYGMFAESEIRAKKFRFQQAKTALMKEGLSIPGKELFGYMRIPYNNKRNTYDEHPENSEIVRKIFFWYINGIEGTGVQNTSISKIVKHCTSLENYPKYTHSKRNINKLLKEEAYTGFKVTNNKRKNPEYKNNKKAEPYIVTKTEIKYPKIISREIFDEVQSLLRTNNTRVEKSNTNTTLLSKLIECDCCGRFFLANYRVLKGVNKSAYRCSGRTRALKCENKKAISLEMLDSAIWIALKSDFKNFSDAVKLFNPDEELKKTENLIIKIKDDIRVIESELQDVSDFQKVLRKVKNNKSMGDNFSEIIKQISKYDKQLGKLNEELLQLENKRKIIDLKNLDFDSIVLTNLDVIERSKESVKNYINFFIDKIIIEHQSVRFSIVKIKMKYYTRSLNKGHINELDDYIYLLIDKKQTLNIKLYKATCSIRFISNKTIRVGGDIVNLEDLQNIDDSLLRAKPRLSELKQLTFKKYHYMGNFLTE